MTLQIIQGSSPGLKSSTPGLVNLIAATFFPIGLVSTRSPDLSQVAIHTWPALIDTDHVSHHRQELCTANFSDFGTQALLRDYLPLSAFLCVSLQASGEYWDTTEKGQLPDLPLTYQVILAMTTLNRRTKVWQFPVNWIIVFFGNLAGMLCYVAFLAHYSDLYNTEAMQVYSRSVSVNKTSPDWGACLLRGIGCNFLGEVA
jgi:hypothetical protein